MKSLLLLLKATAVVTIINHWLPESVAIDGFAIIVIVAGIGATALEASENVIIGFFLDWLLLILVLVML